VKPLHKVQEDIESLKQMLAGLTSGFQRNVALADKLKADTAKVIKYGISMPLAPHMATYNVSKIFFSLILIVSASFMFYPETRIY
jgi:hypothetical protein